jgi:hypothetical protein
MKHLTIVTPCIRISNLFEIADSLKSIPKKKYRWIVVFDLSHIPEDLPKEGEYYAIWKKGSIVGNAQRNYALNMIKEGHIYFNDDDTTIHPDLWESIKDLDNDFISFMQMNKNNTLRLSGSRIEVGYIDSHNFIFSFDILGTTRQIENKYESDGYFAEELYKKSKSPLYIPRVLSIYNSLR